MKAIEIKSELLRMINKETDTDILSAILTLLRGKSLNPVLKQKLNNRALRSEDDIRRGRLLTESEVIKRTDKIAK